MNRALPTIIFLFVLATIAYYQAFSLQNEKDSSAKQLREKDEVLDRFRRENAKLKKLIEQGTDDKLKKFYYFYPPERKYGLDKLESLLKQWRASIIGKYVVNIFDCSEQSAFLERALENDGFRTIIVCGNAPSGSGRHSWLLCEVLYNEFIPIESTQPAVIYPNHPLYRAYFIFDRRFETIFDALNYCPSEFDWWNAQ